MLYEKVADLKRKVLNLVEEECKNYDLHFDVEFKREGRKMKYITFSISKEAVLKAQHYAERQKVVKPADDIIIQHAREIVDKDNLEHFRIKIERRYGNISQIKKGSSRLMFKVIYQDMTWDELTFDDLKSVIDYNNRPLENGYQVVGAHSRANDLIAKFEKTKTYDFDPSMVINS
jgi:plasmid replication initiation protein